MTRLFSILCALLWFGSAQAQISGPGTGGISGPNGGISGPGPGSGNVVPPLGPSAPVGGGVDFTSQTSALFVPAAASLQFGAPWSIAYGITVTGSLSSSGTAFLETNLGAGAGGTGFRHGNSPTITADVAFTYLGVIRPYSTPTTCGAAPTTCARTSQITDGSRHWVVWTFDGTTAKFYIDNVLKDSFGPSAGFITSTNFWQIGNANQPFNLTDLRAYTRALSAADVANLYQYTSASPVNLVPTSGSLTSGFAAYWPLSASTCTSSQCTDSSGNGNTAFFESTPPTVAVLTPTNGATVTGSTNFTASCTDVIGCVSVAWEIDGVTLSTQTTAPYTFAWNSANYVDGAHVVTALATNAGAITGTANANITTSNSVVAQQYFFDVVGGLDTNNCKTSGTACQTIAKANSLTYHGGDSLLFLAGDTWTNSTSFLKLCDAGVSGCTQNVFSAGAAYPILVSTYGGGTCAPIAGTISGCAAMTASGSIVNGIQVLGVSNITVTNTVQTGDAAAIASTDIGAGIFVDNGGTNVTITNNQVVDFADLIYVAGDVGTLTNVTTSNNLLQGSTVTTTVDIGIWYRFGGVKSGLIQGNVVQNIGGRSGGSNYFPGCCGNGILIADGASNVVDQFNVTAHEGRNNITCGGPVGNWAFNTINVTIQFNESFDEAPTSFSAGCDWGGFDLDGGNRNALLQHNYSHDNYGEGISAFIANVGTSQWLHNTIRYNISENDAKGTAAAGGIEIGGATNRATQSAAYNNTIASNADSFSGGYCIYILNDNDMLVANNICYNGGTLGHNELFRAQLLVPSMILLNNDYFRATSSAFNLFTVGSNLYATLSAYQAATGYDVGSVATNPNLTSPLADTTCWPGGVIPAGPQNQPSGCPAGMVLNSGSAMIGTGLDLTSGLTAYGLPLPTRDYYGNTVPNGVGTGFNIGADGGNP